ncbi:hypothetical protein Neosp_015202 [[Neocosmospora] mangrovei]
MATQATENIAADDKASAGGVLPRSALLDDEITDDISMNNHEQRMKDRALLSPDEEKKLLRRVDFRLMILCAIIFMIKNVDANNAANARIMNKGTDRNIMTQLNMTADDYNWVSTVYNIPFMLFEIPTNMIVKKMLPSRFQSRIMVTWGLVLACHAAVKSSAGLLTARFFLGVAKWLTNKEKRFLQARLPPNAPRSSEANFKASEIWDTMKDQRLWWFAFIWASKTIGSTGLSFYLPTIVASLGLASIAESQLLTIPSSVLAIILIAFSGYLTNSLAVPYPAVALAYLISNLACYGVMVAYPNNGGVYAATLIAAGVSLAWFATMWPWRLQTTFRATGSAFAIAWVNALGGIGTIVGPQIFRAKYAPEYTVSFAVAMGMTGACILAICWTWWLTRETERQTRQLRKRRLAAYKNNEVVLDDVDIDADFEKKPRVHA